MFFIKKAILLIVFVLVHHLGFPQLSKTHYIPPLTSSEIGNANPEDQYIYISTPSLINTSYTIKPIGQSANNYIIGTVSNANPKEIYIGTGNGQLFIPSTQTSKVVNDRGYIIEAEAPIYVSIRMNAGNGAQAGALVSKGLAALGNTFRIGTYTNENPQDNYLNFVSVMATEDNTQVNFSNLPVGLIIKNFSGATPVMVSLNKGQSYTIAVNSLDSTINRDGLIGCLVTSDKPIVVNCGSANGSFSNGNGRDYGIDQIAELSKTGTEYIFVKGDGNNDWENVLIVAHSDNTTININGVTTTTINAGNYYLIEGNAYSTNGNMYVNTSQPVFAYQGVGATSNEANQGMFFVPPLSCETRGNLESIAFIDKIGDISYTGGVSIVTKTGATVMINNNPISNYSTFGPNSVIGKPDYVTYKVLGLNGNISVQCDNELYCAYFNYNGAATSGSFYSGFPTAPEVNFEAQFVTLGNCIPNIKLKVANVQSFDSYKWLFDDGSGSGFIDLMITDTEITPVKPGKYKLIGLIACTGEELESLEIPVSICPDDIDNDGIIDNLDIDNDNDGILNCVESKGDVNLNISDIANPQLIFQDGSTDSSFVTSLFSQNNSSGSTSNTFSGTYSGNFTSTVQAVTSGENSYDLKFSKSLNVKFSEAIGVSHAITDGEYFIAKILPSNKNITLIDPHNRLLVDSDFDGVYESGITQLSGSEIHFKINPSPLGNTPYEFLANTVAGFSIIHGLNNPSEASTFTGTISLTCFNVDTDSDGIADALDLDSDNDGIPDIIENVGTAITLSNTDSNLDGLDDIFDSSATPLDSDNDGIYDFYDLDSDNDGIYDLEESGSGFSDSDFDGVIDNVNLTVGTNGWHDNAETSPDSNMIDYSVLDTDSDNLFNYRDSDCDGDDCSDVIEAGFSDGNGDHFLGNIDVTVNAFGIVNNVSDGYSTPNPDYLIGSPITIVVQPLDTVLCELSSGIISITPTIADFYQWEVSIDDINWTTIVDDAVYSGSQSSSLNINNVTMSYNSNRYRVKLDRKGNACGLYSDEIELTINALPVINSPVTLVQCDDDDLTTLGYSPFNLTEANTKISSNSDNESFSYFLSEVGAISGDISSPDYIDNPIAFINHTISSDTVWVRIENTYDCASISEIQLFVSTTVIPNNFLVTFNQCDDFLDIDGNDNVNNNDRDGIANFNFSSVTSDILSFIPPGQSPLPPRFYRNEADALAETNEIIDISNYRNIEYSNSQYIYVRVDSSIANDCLALGPHILLNVETLPYANPISIGRQCDDDQDGMFSFDTSQIQTEVLGGQNPDDVNIYYFDENNNPLPSPLPNPFLTSSQIVTVLVENKVTNAPDGPCYAENSFEFIVDAQPIANPVAPQIVCDGSVDDIDDDGIYPFDTSTFVNTILQGQTGMGVYFDYIDEFGTLITNVESLPNPLMSGSQIINVNVANPVNTSCTASTTIELVVNPLPEFSIETPQIVCSSNPSFTVILDPQENNVLETYYYDWRYQDGTLLSNASTLTVSKPGTYSVTLTKTDGTGCSRTKEIFVNASELATITLDDISIVDISENNTLTINDSGLGLGNYEYALEDINTTLFDEAFFNFQDDLTFENLKGGLYKLYVRDKNGCGTTYIDVSIIGFPKFFTPNGDGYHDSWKVYGVNSVFNTNINVKIFNRFGKFLIEQNYLSPGWDGTLNGYPMPSDDYWFLITFDDGRTYRGHFALVR